MPNQIFYTLQKSSSPFLYKRLLDYSSEDWYPFHMPGHKRAPLAFPNPYSIDITEIEGFDNLHHPQGILKEAQERAAMLYGSRETFFLVNGSTSGILAAISAAIPRQGTLLMSRNSHKAAYHAAYLRELETVYLLPAGTGFGIAGSIQPAHVAQALEDLPQIDGVFLTSPTYDGILSDIRKIADLAHSRGLPLIVDEAHGAHLAFSEEFPAPALQCGADLVIQSLHKTLPCLTQTALLHVNSSRIDLDVLRRFLGIYQTSSPSYLLMASMEQCIRYMKTEGRERMAQYLQLLAQFYTRAKNLRRLQVFEGVSCTEGECFAQDISKILISAGSSGLSGKELYDTLLNRYHLQMEMASGHYVTALSSLMDTEEGFQRLISALEEIDKNSYSHAPLPKSSLLDAQAIYRLPKPSMSISKALDCPSESLPLRSSIGHISQEYIYLYPPGIPLAAPGEILTGSLLSVIGQCQAEGLPIEGPSDITNNRIRVVKG